MKKSPLQRLSESELMAMVQCELLAIQVKAVASIPPKEGDFVYHPVPNPQPFEHAAYVGAY